MVHDLRLEARGEKPGLSEWHLKDKGKRPHRQLRLTPADSRACATPRSPLSAHTHVAPSSLRNTLLRHIFRVQPKYWYRKIGDGPGDLKSQIRRRELAISAVVLVNRSSTHVRPHMRCLVYLVLCTPSLLHTDQEERPNGSTFNRHEHAI